MVPRRTALLAAPALLAAAAPARAQEGWPNRPVTLSVPFAPGGSNDVVARLLSPRFDAATGQPFVVENRPGGGGTVGMLAVARARPDGQTLLVSSASNHVFHPLVSGDASHDARDMFSAVAMWVDVPNVVAVHPSLPVRSIPELVAHIRAQRGGMSFGSSGVGTSNHLAGELFRLRAGVELTHIPYRGGGPALTDLVAGTIQLAFMNLPTVLPPAEAGRLRVLAVCTAERVALRPDLPTVQEGGVPDYAVRSWTGLFAPRGTPEAAIRRMEQLSREALEAPPVRQRLADIGSEPIFMDAATTDRFVRAEYDRWGPIVRAAGVRIE